MPKSGPGEEGSRPGGSGQVEAEDTRKASPGAMGSSKDIISTDYFKIVDRFFFKSLDKK